VYEKTCQRALAPTATLVGALTSRMVHIVDKYSKELGICSTPYLEMDKLKISTIEVFPTATLFQIIKSRGKENKFKTNDYLEPYNNNEKDSGKFTKIKSYKKDKKDSPGHFTYINNEEKIDNKKRMLELIKPYLANETKELEEKIQTDDDYDAIICALTAYLVDKNCYEKPENKDFDKFTNSFIYIPKLSKNPK